MKIRFVIPGKPRGYVATTKAGKWSKEYEKFREYAKFVRQCARLEGIKLPLVATKDKPLIIKTIAYFKDGVHCDPGNVQKGVCDILFYDEDKYIPRGRGRGKGTRKGDDKYTGGSFPPPRYDKKNPRVVVIIKSYPQPEEEKKP